MRALYFGLVLAAVGCSTARGLRPLERGEWAVDLSAPGAWTQSGQVAFPVGTVVTGGRYGLGEGREVRLSWHPTEIVVGVASLEIGGVAWRRAAQGWVPGLALSSDLSLMMKPSLFSEGLSRSVRGALDVSVAAHWEPWGWLWPYVVHENVLILADGQYLSSIYGGGQIWFTKRVGLSIETGWAAHNTRTRRYTQPYMGIAGQGVLWLGWSVTYQWSPPAPAPDPVPAPKEVPKS